MNKESALQTLLTPETKVAYTLPVDKGDNVLVISPHPDDETIGCGGAIIKILSSAINVEVVILTDGEGGGRIKDIGRIRKKEFFNARSVLGFSAFEILNYPDGQLTEHQRELGEKIYKILFKQAPKLILLPYILDYHVDHQSANLSLAHALSIASPFNTIIGMYEIWTPITNPNCYLNITEEYSKKRMAMECYQSQENYFGIIDKAEALASFRAKLLQKRRVKYVECFKLLEAKNYIELIEAWKTVQHQEKGSEIKYAVY